MEPSSSFLMGSTRLVVGFSLVVACGATTFEENFDVSVCSHTAGPFSATITNPYFPLAPGTRWVLEGTEGGTSVKLEITVKDQPTVIAGVPTRVMEERETQGGILVEVSQNFFAQTGDGTVCYFGEDVDIYQGGVVTSHEGQWRAGTGNAEAGVFMPATPALGMKFRQEIAPGVAEDRVEITAVGESVTVPFGTFTQTIKFRETTPLEPGSVSTKYYARTVGQLVDDVVRLTSKTP